MIERGNQSLKVFRHPDDFKECLPLDLIGDAWCFDFESTPGNLYFPADELANRRHISIPDIRDCTALFGRATEDGHRGTCRKVHIPKGSSLDREMLAAQQIRAFEF